MGGCNCRLHKKKVHNEGSVAYFSCTNCTNFVDSNIVTFILKNKCRLDVKYKEPAERSLKESEYIGL